MFMESYNAFLILLEWLSIIFIIATQKNRSVEEILFDHTHEPMGTGIISGIKSNEKVYRRADLLIYKAFILSVILMALYQSCVLYLYSQNSIYGGNMQIGRDIFFISVWILTYLTLVYLMKRYHVYEYNRTKKQIHLTFIIYLIVMLADLFVWI